VTKSIPGGDTQPWYRQFWPWFLILLPASVVVAAVSTAFIANEHADDLVVDDYYTDGLAINRQLEKKERATALGISARLRFRGDRVDVATAGPVQEEQLELLLSHPMEADRDFTVTLARVSQGVYRGTLPAAVAPHWLWILREQRDDGWRLDGTVEAADISHATGD